MTYATRVIHDADSHLMEGFDWLHEHADATTRSLLPDLRSALDKGGAGAESAVTDGHGPHRATPSARLRSRPT